MIGVLEVILEILILHIGYLHAKRKDYANFIFKGKRLNQLEFLKNQRKIELAPSAVHFQTIFRNFTLILVSFTEVLFKH